jgi:ribonuclease PH
MTPSAGAGASASAINACSIAALDAGSIAIRNVAVAVVVAFDASDDMLLDPDEDELAHAKSVHAFAWAGDDVVWVESEGAFSRQQVCSATSAGS